MNDYAVWVRLAASGLLLGAVYWRKLGWSTFWGIVFGLTLVPVLRAKLPLWGILAGGVTTPLLWLVCGYLWVRRQIKKGTGAFGDRTKVGRHLEAALLRVERKPASDFDGALQLESLVGVLFWPVDVLLELWFELTRLVTRAAVRVWRWFLASWRSACRSDSAS